MKKLLNKRNDYYNKIADYIVKNNSPVAVQNENISGLENLGIRDWNCPKCGAHHNRDHNATINILNKGLEIVGTTMQ